MRILAVLYGLLALAVGVMISTYQIAFVGDFLVPRTVDRGGMDGSLGISLCINTVLLVIFGAQHSIMARPWFKGWWTKVVPEPIERSTYVLLVGMAYTLLFWQWRPVTAVIWHIENQVAIWLIWAVFAFGWAILLWASHLVNPWDMWGFRHVWAFARSEAYKSLNFQVSGPYRWIRHPIMLGLFLAFWAAPTMTVGHALFAAMMTFYGVIATVWEERDLIRNYPDYEDYRNSTPMIFPRLRRMQKALEDKQWT
jgi:protein-S-isoprenylcysteine O-methyltransferase Ste14